MHLINWSSVNIKQRFLHFAVLKHSGLCHPSIWEWLEASFQIISSLSFYNEKDYSQMEVSNLPRSGSPKKFSPRSDHTLLREIVKKKKDILISPIKRNSRISRSIFPDRSHIQLAQPATSYTHFLKELVLTWQFSTLS